MSEDADSFSRKGQHLNSLGYVIQSGYADGGRDKPMIVWARAADGSRVGIEEAHSGGGQSLSCECGSGLIAKKGEVYAHHFAHENGAICQEAYTSALRHFVLETLLEAGSVKLPPSWSKVGFAEIAAAQEVVPSSLALIELDAQNGRKLMVVATSKKQPLEEVADSARAQDVSAMAIDIRRFRSMPDQAIRSAIVEQAPRSWLHHRGRNWPIHNDPRAQTIDLSEVKRRLFPDIFG